MLATNVDNYLTLALEKFDKVKNTHTHMCIVEVALFVDLVALFSWIGWLRYHEILS